MPVDPGLLDSVERALIAALKPSENHHHNENARRPRAVFTSPPEDDVSDDPLDALTKRERRSGFVALTRALSLASEFGAGRTRLCDAIESGALATLQDHSRKNWRVLRVTQFCDWVKSTREGNPA
jgi:hypothetical protein